MDDKAAPSAAAEPPVLDIRQLTVSFTQYGKGLRQRELTVISGLDVGVRAGEIVAVVGASGSGKSLLAHAILGILPGNATASGSIRYRGEQLTPKRQSELRGTHIAFIPQSVECLDPLMRVGRQVCGTRQTAARQRAIFERYGLDERVEQLYPFELSGGMARRVLVSTAVIEDADLIIADEPTPGLTRAMALEALGTFQELARAGKAVLLITHDLDLASVVADRIAVFYAGTTLEVADAADFRTGPGALRHPYSEALWNALPQHGFSAVPGTQPYAGDVVAGCPFAPRCPRADGACREGGPIPVRDLRGGKVRCLHAS